MYINEFIKDTYRIKDHEDRNGYLCLDMNENPEGLPEEFVQSVLKKVTPQFLASYPVKEPLIEKIARREGVGKENVSLTNGSDEGIRLVFETFTHPGGRLLTVAPTFEMYQVYGSMFGVKLDTVSFGEDFSIAEEEVLKNIHEDTDLVVLLNPNSPIGAEFSDEAVERIVEKAGKANAVVLIDEAYYPYGVESRIDFCRAHPHVIVLRTFSKLCSMAALRVGYMVGGRECIHLIENAKSTYNVNAVGILFARELLEREDILNTLKENIDQGRDYLVQKLSGQGYTFYGSKGNYLLIKPFRAPEEICRELRENKILIKTYRKGLLKDWLRVTLGSKEIMRQFWEAFYKAEGCQA